MNENGPSTNLPFDINNPQNENILDISIFFPSSVSSSLSFLQSVQSLWNSYFYTRSLYPIPSLTSTVTNTGFNAPILSSPILEAINAPWLAQQVAGYLWEEQSHGIHFSIVQTSSLPSSSSSSSSSASSLRPSPSSYYLSTSVRLGETTEDEWFITWLMFQLSTLSYSSSSFMEDHFTHYRLGSIVDTWEQYQNILQDIVIHVQDMDGDYLLIEAADVLPRWMKPEIMKHRLYIYRGHLHIIPHPAITASTPTTSNKHVIVPEHVQQAALLHVPSLSYGAEWIRHHPIGTRQCIVQSSTPNTPPPTTSTTTATTPAPVVGNSSPIEEIINERLQIYNQQALHTLYHYSVVHLPVRVCKLLLVYPNLLGPMVHAFHNRDSFDIIKGSALKIMLPMTNTSSSSSSIASAITTTNTNGNESLTNVRMDTTDSGNSSDNQVFLPMVIKFTRSLYAQLMQPKFYPPKKYLLMVPSSGHKSQRSTSSVSTVGSNRNGKVMNRKDYTFELSYEIGMRLTIGSEILLAQGKGLNHVQEYLSRKNDTVDQGTTAFVNEKDLYEYIYTPSTSSLSKKESSKAKLTSFYASPEDIPSLRHPSEIMGYILTHYDKVHEASLFQQSLPYVQWPPNIMIPNNCSSDDKWLYEEDNPFMEQLDTLLTGKGGSSLKNNNNSDSNLSNISSTIPATSTVNTVDPETKHLQSLISSMHTFMQQNANIEGISSHINDNDDESSTEYDDNDDDSDDSSDGIDDHNDSTNEKKNDTMVVEEMNGRSTDTAVQEFLSILQAATFAYQQQSPVNTIGTTGKSLVRTAVRSMDDEENEPTIQDYMAAMDAQLYGYSVNTNEESVSNTSSKGKRRANADDDSNHYPEMNMNANISQRSVLGQSFVRYTEANMDNEDTQFDSAVSGGTKHPKTTVPSPTDTLTDNDVNYNLSVSFAEAVQSQQGTAGPVSNIMRSNLGLTVPKEWWSSSSSSQRMDTEEK